MFLIASCVFSSSPERYVFTHVYLLAIVFFAPVISLDTLFFSHSAPHFIIAFPYLPVLLAIPLKAQATHRLSPAPTQTEVGVISPLLAISYLAHAIAHSVAIFAGIASFPRLCIADTLFGHTRLAHISVHVRPRLAQTVVGSYAQYSFIIWLHFSPICQSFSADAFCSPLSCQYVLSDNHACIAVQIMLHGIYCHALDQNSATFHKARGTCSIAPPTTSQINPHTFSTNPSL